MPRKILTCAVKDCRSSSGVGDKLLFCFPKERVACQKWVDFCENPEINQKFLSGSLTSLNYLRVCHLHFKRESFTHDLRNKLIRGAVPTLLHADIIEGHNAESFPDVPQSNNPRIISHGDQDQRHIIEEHSELYSLITLPYLEQTNLNLQWVYKILSGEEGCERIVYESPDKDDKDGFMLIRDSKWDGINLDNLHLIAIAYRPGIMSLRDLGRKHLRLLHNIYHWKGPDYGTVHSLHSVIQNIQISPTYYQDASLSLHLKESDELFQRFEAQGIVKRIQPSS